MTRRYWFPKHYADEVQRLRVPLGFVLLVLFVWFAVPTVASLEWGLCTALPGLLLRAWAASHLAKNEELAVSGPYAWIRNPLYVGSLVTALGFVVASRQVGLGILFGLAFLLVYLPAIELEEQHLRKLFPGYAEYAEHVPLLVPRKKPIPSGGRFRLSLYLRNQEYQALGGAAIAAAYLAWRAGLFPF